MKKILLVSMPFGAMERPALGLSLLKARVTRDGIVCDVRYPSFTFADLLGAEKYQWISSALPYIAFAGDWCFAEALYGPRPAADVGYLAEVLQKTWRLSTKTIAAVKEVRAMAEKFLDHCMECIPWEDYAIVGFTSTFEQNLASLALAKRIKAVHPRIAIVFGGANWEGEMGEELHRQFRFVDYVCLGEADESFPVLAALLLTKTAKAAALPRGIVYRENGRSLSTGRPMPVRNMDALPFPDFSDYFRAWSESSASLVTVPTVLIETSRGCWWGDKSHCTFCGLNGATLAYRSKSSARALEEMRFLSDRWQTDRIEVVDNILDMRYFSDLLPALAKDGRPWEIFYEVKANLTRAQVATLRAAGVTRIQPGIESLSDHVLKLMRKGTCGLRNVQLLKWCRELGIRVDWNLLYGFPGETREDYEQMLAMLPSIEFLDPPVACGPIRMDRFSPYFEAPVGFGLTNVRPMNPYAFLYPFSKESLMRIAYHFDFNYLGEAPTGFADDVIRFTEAWRQKAQRGLLSSVRQRDGSLLLRDTRLGAAMREVRLSGSEAEAYEFCDEFRSLAAILRHLREHSPSEKIAEEGVRAFLESLVTNRLMLTDGRNWLSLAVRVRDIQRGNTVDCEAGPTVGRNAGNHPHMTTRIFNTR
jgi:ribosomal peptide maturation radical SAM protein 1